MSRATFEARVERYFRATAKLHSGLRCTGSLDERVVFGTQSAALFVRGVAERSADAARAIVLDVSAKPGFAWQSNAAVEGCSEVGPEHVIRSLASVLTTPNVGGVSVSLNTLPDDATREADRAAQTEHVAQLEKLVERERAAHQAAVQAKYMTATSRSNLERAKLALQSAKARAKGDSTHAHALLVSLPKKSPAAFDLRQIHALLKLAGAKSGTLRVRGALDPADLVAEGPDGPLFALVMPFRLESALEKRVLRFLQSRS